MNRNEQLIATLAWLQVHSQKLLETRDEKYNERVGFSLMAAAAHKFVARGSAYGMGQMTAGMAEMAYHAVLLMRRHMTEVYGTEPAEEGSSTDKVRTMCAQAEMITYEIHRQLHGGTT